MKKLFFAAMALVLATPALADTYVIPAKVATDAAACPKVAIVAAEPGSTISAARLPKTQGNYADINLKTGKAKVGRCIIKISGFANAIGAPWGATLTGDDNANVLTGIADNKNGAASDWIVGNGGDDNITVVAETAVVTGGAGSDTFHVPAAKVYKVGGYFPPFKQADGTSRAYTKAERAKYGIKWVAAKTVTQSVIEDRETGDIVAR